MNKLVTAVLTLPNFNVVAAALGSAAAPVYHFLQGIIWSVRRHRLTIRTGLCVGLFLGLSAGVATAQPIKTTTPDLSSLSSDERQSIEYVCQNAKILQGPAAYKQCLRSQLATLAKGTPAPDLTRLSSDERQSIEYVCQNTKILQGPAAYNQCLREQFDDLSRGFSASAIEKMRPKSIIISPIETLLNSSKAAQFNQNLVESVDTGVLAKSLPSGQVCVDSSCRTAATIKTPPEYVMALFIFGLLVCTFSFVLFNFKARVRDSDRKENHRNSNSRTNNNNEKSSKLDESWDDHERPWFEVLDVVPFASFDEIRVAYRTKINKSHPDKVATLAKEFRELAEKRTREINAAYARATKLRRSQ